jgi:hypothetical protein
VILEEPDEVGSYVKENDEPSGSEMEVGNRFERVLSFGAGEGQPNTVCVVRRGEYTE